MEKNNLIEKIFVNEKTRNKTEYVLTERGLKTKRILYELSFFALKELDIKFPSKEFKEELECYYETVLN